MIAATADRNEFAPPPQRMQLRATALAVAAHLALLGALTWGVSWKQDADLPAVEAELWSSVPKFAAPKPVEPPPPPPAPAPAPAPKPAPAPPPKPADDAQRDADIAVERAKKQRELDKQERLRQEQKEKEQDLRERKEAEAKKQKERDLKEREEDKREKAAADKKAEDKKKLEADAKRKEAAAKADDAKRAEAQRQENLKRIAGLAGATGAANATGDAQRSSGPSGSYGGKVVAKVKPNVVFSDDIPGNPEADVEVRSAPDGTITSARIVKSSGNKAWDDAVVRAVQKTETMPRDTDGRVPALITIGFRPRDVGL